MGQVGCVKVLTADVSLVLLPPLVVLLPTSKAALGNEEKPN